jgi:hypothetical protein
MHLTEYNNIIADNLILRVGLSQQKFSDDVANHISKSVRNQSPVTNFRLL